MPPIEPYDSFGNLSIEPTLKSKLTHIYWSINLHFSVNSVVNEMVSPFIVLNKFEKEFINLKSECYAK